uniref:uncharacterized protein LOC128932631 n=1 Tax=Callithrix jacchus TaxID=9483 RepID=UPI0023DCFDFE|nr:uncharacterized protein LOC128932631 [Callithrix jacchus]
MPLEFLAGKSIRGRTRKCQLCSGFHHQPAHARSWKTQQHRLYFRLAPREGPASENFTVPRLWRRHSDAPPAHRQASSDITATCLRRTDGPPATSQRRASGAQTGLRRRHRDTPVAHRRASGDITAARLWRTDGPPATSRRRSSGAQTGFPRRHRGGPSATSRGGVLPRSRIVLSAEQSLVTSTSRCVLCAARWRRVGNRLRPSTVFLWVKDRKSASGPWGGGKFPSGQEFRSSLANRGDPISAVPPQPPTYLNPKVQGCDEL